MADLHEITFTWPDASPHTVIVTGTFDQWSSSIHLTKGASDFSGTAQIPWESTVEYKFIVDGHWTTRNDQPTTTDPAGNVNNIYHSPPKP
ncbi:carbohydrate-binding module family 48 protein, partial [Plicaturopsis crispa FD-325 SS-3]